MKAAKIRRALWSVVALVLALMWVFPVYWMINSALLPNRVLQSFVPTFVPFGGSLRNFEAVLSDGSFYTALKMSVSITLIAVAGCLIFAFLAALAISRFRFRGRKSFIMAVLLIQMLPAEGLFIAQYKMVSSAGLLNSVIGISVIYMAMVIPFTVWMLRGFVAGVHRVGGSRPGRWPLPLQGVHEDHTSAARARPGRLRCLRVPAVLE